MNPRLAHISASLIREIAAKRKATSIDLGLGEPSLMPKTEHLEAGTKYAYQFGLRYTTNAGDLELRRAIAEHYGYPKLNHADNVCITTGSQEATYAVLKTVLDPAKDEVLVVEPAFPSYAKMAQLEGASVRTVAMSESDGFAFDAERIIAAVTPATRVIVICSPCNPTARVIRRDAVIAVSEALLSRAGEPIWVLHDEIYREQTFVDDAGYFAQHYPHTIVTNSVSKSNALTGLRLGWAMLPHHIAPALVKVHAWVTSCADTFAQQVVLHIFKTDALGEYAAWYEEHRAMVLRALQGSGLRYIAPEGSFYACVRLPEGVESLRASHELVDEHDVVAIPGIAFGQCFEGWLRLSWVGDPKAFAQGLQRIADYSLSVLQQDTA
ncbi:MAG TPA: pyridoxal phosphate-dependent aminotransferase [Candidatus Baltobacteraceae bacterium]|jgi:aspartate/methionine/tyrosine aminotransferase|nr:pyridoxal phosphate-dependent aminotransferase [Candidatus Baltobacteraceae bacterium]